MILQRSALISIYQLTFISNTRFALLHFATLQSSFQFLSSRYSMSVRLNIGGAASEKAKPLLAQHRKCSVHIRHRQMTKSYLGADHLAHSVKTGINSFTGFPRIHLGKIKNTITARESDSQVFAYSLNQSPVNTVYIPDPTHNGQRRPTKSPRYHLPKLFLSVTVAIPVASLDHHHNSRRPSCCASFHRDPHMSLAGETKSERLMECK